MALAALARRLPGVERAPRRRDSLSPCGRAGLINGRKLTYISDFLQAIVDSLLVSGILPGAVMAALVVDEPGHPRNVGATCKSIRIYTILSII